MKHAFYPKIYVEYSFFSKKHKEMYEKKVVNKHIYL